MKLFCPIRGELNIEEKAKDNITFTEESRRIELVKFLLSKNYPKELFDFEKNVWDIGNAGKNHLRADLVIYNSSKTSIDIIAEIKRDNKNKENAVLQQLYPACIRQKVIYGIYYDGVENIFFYKNDNYEKEYSLLKFPVYNFNFEDKPLKYSDLVEIDNINEVINKLDQLLYNIGTTKERRYRELFKIIKCKYFDEKENNNEDEILRFQTSNNTAENIKNLYEDAKNYYNDDTDNKINLPNDIIEKIVKLLENYSFSQSKQDIIQTLFMKFAQSTLKIELDQFYTPIDITEFMISLIKIKNTTKIIDPAGGSADFLVSCLKKNQNSSKNIYYWDKDKDALDVAKLNMILNGDGRTQIKQQDTIEKYNESNSNFDFVITNLPFGNKTIFEGSKEVLKKYQLYNNCNYKQLGVLYIERSMNLLKNSGTLLIIVPNGFLTNPDDIGLRDYIIDNYRIIAYISMPVGAFKNSGTGVKTGILIVKKEKMNNNYKIFTDVAINIGFNYHTKQGERLYKLDNRGEYILDSNNHKIVLTDLSNIADKFKQFTYDEQLNEFESENNNLKYNFLTIEEIKQNSSHIIRPETNTDLYISVCQKIKQNNFFTLKNYEVDNKLSFTKIKTHKYFYIDISNLEKGNYLLLNKMYGWELPNRAKQSVKKYDIIVSKLQGSLDKFSMILNDNYEDIVVTNGCYRIRIEDENIRLSFYKFLFSKEYKVQMESLATGSIMLDVKKDDLKNNLYFPMLDIKELTTMKEFIKQQEFFVKLRNGL